MTRPCWDCGQRQGVVAVVDNHRGAVHYICQKCWNFNWAKWMQVKG